MPAVVDEHYEEEFRFPLLRLIKERAQQLDISYSEAYEQVLPEYEKTIRYGDRDWEDGEVRRWNEQQMRTDRRESCGSRLSSL